MLLLENSRDGEQIVEAPEQRVDRSRFLTSTDESVDGVPSRLAPMGRRAPRST
jgi:hypothetical protein